MSKNEPDYLYDIQTIYYFSVFSILLSYISIYNAGCTGF